MKVKLLTLMLGVPLAAWGARRLGDDGLAGMWWLAPGIALFLVGQTIVRFEDFPAGTRMLARIAAWLT